jgi:outer membrane protein assembly factor BamB
MLMRVRLGRIAAACGLLVCTAAASDASPPAIRWTHAATGWGEPATAGGLAYFMTREHEVVALDAGTGALRWRVSTGGRGDAPWGSAIRVAGNAVLVGDGSVVALDGATGARRWVVDPGSGPFLGSVSGGVVYTGSPDGILAAIDTDTGTARWRRRLSPSAAATVFAPVIDGGLVVATYRRHSGSLAGGVAVFDRAGRRQWQRALARHVGVAGPPIVVGGNVMVAVTDGTIACWELATGRRCGTLPPVDPEESGRAGSVRAPIRALSRAGNLLVAGSLSGRIVAYDIAHLREVWRYAHPDGAATLRLRADRATVYAPFTDDTLVAIDATTGRERWRVGGEGARVEWPPAIGDGAIYLAGTDALMALAGPAVEVSDQPR